MGLLLAFLLVLAPVSVLADEAEPADDPLEAVTIEGEADPLDANSGGTVNVYRLYNWRTSEHLYTTSFKEYNTLPWYGWVREGIAWVAPKKSSTPVYRLYNPRSGDHHYTTSKGERDKLVRNHGWKSEGIAFYSDDSKRVPLYRVYNGRLKAGQHHYTSSKGERDSLVRKSGWRNEGTGFYAVRGGNLIKPKYPNSVPAGTYRWSSHGYTSTAVLNLDGTVDWMRPDKTYEPMEDYLVDYAYYVWFPATEGGYSAGEKVIQLGGWPDETGSYYAYRSSGKPRLEDVLWGERTYYRV